LTISVPGVNQDTQRVTYSFTREDQDYEDRTVVDSRRDGSQTVERPDLTYEDQQVNVGKLVTDVVYRLNLANSTGLNVGSHEFTSTEETYETDLSEVQAWWVDFFGGLAPGDYDLSLETTDPFFGSGPITINIPEDEPSDP